MFDLNIMVTDVACSDIEHFLQSLVCKNWLALYNVIYL